MYYMHSQLENDSFDNGLLCTFLVWLSCFQFLGSYKPHDKEVKKNVGTAAKRTLGNSSPIKCSFLSLYRCLQCFLAPSQLQGIPHSSSPTQQLAATSYGLGTLWEAAPSFGWTQCLQISIIYLFILFLCCCLCSFSPWTWPSYIKYSSIFSGFVPCMSLLSLFDAKCFQLCCLKDKIEVKTPREISFLQRWFCPSLSHHELCWDIDIAQAISTFLREGFLQQMCFWLRILKNFRNYCKAILGRRSSQ